MENGFPKVLPAESYFLNLSERSAEFLERTVPGVRLRFNGKAAHPKADLVETRVHSLSVWTSV